MNPDSSGVQLSLFGTEPGTYFLDALANEVQEVGTAIRHLLLKARELYDSQVRIEPVTIDILLATLDHDVRGRHHTLECVWSEPTRGVLSLRFWPSDSQRSSGPLCRTTSYRPLPSETLLAAAEGGTAGEPTPLVAGTLNQY